MSLETLYKNLFASIPHEDPTDEQKIEVAEKIGHLDTTGLEIVYILLKMSQLRETSCAGMELPYEGKTVGKDHRFHVEKLPPKLVHVLLKFADMHLQKMEDEKKRGHVHT